MKNHAFTLIELLVVVLIIGILAAIAVPQYQKAVMKANLHKGIPIVESLYQAQQAYFLAHGNYATDVDDLDLSIPVDESCTKEQSDSYSRYTCNFGTIGRAFSSMQYKDISNSIAYTYYLEDSEEMFTKGSRWCYALGTSKTAQEVCENLGGKRYGEFRPGWNYYKLN